MKNKKINNKCYQIHKKFKLFWFEIQLFSLNKKRIKRKRYVRRSSIIKNVNQYLIYDLVLRYSGFQFLFV